MTGRRGKTGQTTHLTRLCHHQRGPWQEEKEARYRRCIRCHQEDSQALPAKEPGAHVHRWGPWGRVSPWGQTERRRCTCGASISPELSDQAEPRSGSAQANEVALRR